MSLRLACSIFHYFPHGGLQRDLLAFIESAIARGHKIDLFAQRVSGTLPAEVQLHTVAPSAWSNHQRAAQFSQHIAQLPSTAYDAIIGFNKMAGLNIYFAGDNCLAKEIPWYKKWLPRYQCYLALEKQVFSTKTKTHIFVLTPQQQKAYTQNYHTPEERFTLLPPSLSSKFIHGQALFMQRNHWRDNLGLTPQNYALLMVASYFRTKGLDRALNTLAALPADLQKRCHLFIVGGDNPKPYLKQLRHHPIISHIHFMGSQENILPFYLSADVLIHPAYQEAAGQVLLEALYCGLPVLTTQNCGYSYHIENAQAGKILPASWPLSQSVIALQEILSIPRQTWWQRLSSYKNHFAFNRGEQLITWIEEHYALP